MKKVLSILLVASMIIMSAAATASADRVIDVKADTCSVDYGCDSIYYKSYPVRFALPENHKTARITLVAESAGSFNKSMSDALYGMPAVFGGYTNGGIEAVMSLLNTGVDYAVISVELMPGVYQDLGYAICAAVSGFSLATYHVRLVTYDGKEQTFTIPIGETTLCVSDRVQYIDVRSESNPGMNQYTAGKIPGAVAYKNYNEF